MTSLTETPLRTDPFPRFAPPLELIRGKHRGNKHCDTVSDTAAIVMVAHSTPLVAAGMASLLARQPMLQVRVWNESQGPWSGNGTDAVDIVFADSECLRLSRWNHHTAVHGQAISPRVIWVTSVSDELVAPPSQPTGISAKLSVECGEEDLFEALKKFTEGAATVSRHALVGNFTDGLASCTTSGVPRRHLGGLAPSALRRVREHIEKCLGQHIDLGELAVFAGLSPCHFSRAFKQSMGMPPHRYLMSRRVVAAAKLIESTELPMSEIALEVGFSDQSHFTRVFTAQIGESPRRFRHKHR